MKNLYEMLGIDSNATETQIKKAYRKLALDAHPDKGGDAEKMGLLNEAYQTLSDPEKRREFDLAWNVYNATNDEDQSPTILTDYLTAGNIRPYSDTYRYQYNEMVVKYRTVPLELNTSKFEQSLFDQDFNSLSETKFLLSSPINPAIAVKLLIACISGGYHDQVRLKNIKDYFSYHYNLIFTHTPKSPELELYEGIREIIFMLSKTPQEQTELIFSIKKITDFAKQVSDPVLLDLLPLFYNQFFRQLHTHALNLYWHSEEDLFQEDPRKLFNGYIETKELLNLFRERLSRESNEHLNELIQYLNLLFRFEKDLQDTEKNAKTAAAYREMAFRGLDWIPVFIEKSSKPLLSNLFLQLGILFQQASHLEIESFEQMMADEQFALKLYMTAMAIGHHSTPDAEIYINTQIIRYLSAFRFSGHIDCEILTALKKKTLTMVDIFPFFEAPQSNVSLFRQNGRALHLMRQLLNIMLNAYEYNKTHSDEIPIPHKASNILYQAYEASLKNWYQEEYNPELENKFRKDLMEELLFDQGWTSFDVEERIDSPWIMVDRDKQGWIKPTRSLPYTEDETFTKYCSINGAEINHDTGEINFFMTPWDPSYSPHEKVFTLFDLQEMLEKNISGAVFSLDPVDPDKPYHPYNLMRFAPTQLFESELLNTMLLTDYILKFLTTNQEVQGCYPFDQRPISSMIQHLPKYLRQIIENFHEAQHSGALHRFWIEAEEIDVALDESHQDQNMTKIGLGSLKMIVKKHRMERDIHGELKDAGNEDEGWPIYVLTAEQMQQLQQGILTIDSHAMIFIHARPQLYYWENNEVLLSHVPVDYRETLIRLFKQPKDIDGKVEVSTKNMRLIYRITRNMAEQTGQSHRYSAEFIFAHEFTNHYDEFAQYLPEFGRLKELSKMSVLVRFLDGIRQNNQESIEAIDSIIAYRTHILTPPTGVYQTWAKNDLEIRQKVSDIFNNHNSEFSVAKITKVHRENLNQLKKEIGILEFSPYSSEVDKAFEELVQKTEQANQYRFSSSQIRNELSNKRHEIAKHFSEKKKTAVHQQLKKLFSSDYIVDAFMQGNIEPAVNARVIENLQQQFPDSDASDILLAIEQNSMAIQRIASQESHKILTQHKHSLNFLKQGFEKINFGKNASPVDLEGTCLWVPASVRHEAPKDSGLKRYSFFVYGGVSIQPRTNIISGGNAPLRGNAVSGNSFNRAQITKGFQDHHIASDKNRFTKNHELWKLAGMNANSRANKIYLPKSADQHPTRSVHSGRHTNEYSRKIERSMSDIIEIGKKAGWSQTQYRSATQKVLSEIRQELRAGNIALNKNHRPWANKW